MQIETMGIVNFRYKEALNVIGHVLRRVVQETGLGESTLLSALP